MTRAKLAADLRTKFLPLFRRSSTSSVASSTASSIETSPTLYKTGTRSKASLAPAKGRTAITENIEEEGSRNECSEHPNPGSSLAAAPATSSTVGSPTSEDVPSPGSVASASPAAAAAARKIAKAPELTLEGATPESQRSPGPAGRHPQRPHEHNHAAASNGTSATAAEEDAAAEALVDQVLRKQSLALHSDHRLVRSLLQSHDQQYGLATAEGSGAATAAALDRTMVHRKIWVRRPGASPTLVQINEEDLVDDVRDKVLRKYGNSLGRSFDSPDVTLRIVAREHSHRHHPGSGSGGGGALERTLGPEEHMTRTLDAFYPGGQTVDEALVIDVPRRTPRQSPRVAMPYYAVGEDMRPAETDQGYFPVMPAGVVPSPHLASSVAGSAGSGSHHHAISVLNTGVVPPLPSPGSRSTRPGHRPRFGRNNTSSPTAMTGVVPHNGKAAAHARHGSSSEMDVRLHAGTPAAPPLPTPPVPGSAPPRTATPPPRPASPRPLKQKRASRRNAQVPSPLPGPLLDVTVPPINVLIVEDNIINLKLLEAFMKRLKVRWHTAMNGRDAVKKWRDGGFHLVLMDIQLPLMNGLDATKEIRRLEKVNGVGVLGSGPHAKGEEPANVQEKDRLPALELFKSSVIIVALTASSLQSDRHEALAAGCNDFLTKPVNFVWLERKVTEWGCMQALIDYEGWRNWKEFPPPKPTAGTTKTTKTTLAASRLKLVSASGAASTTGSVSRDSGQAAPGASNMPGVSVQAPTPPASAPAKLSVRNGTGDAAEQDASPTSQSAPGSKTTSPTSARAADGAGKRGKRSSLSRGGSELTGVAEEGVNEDGKAVEA